MGADRYEIRIQGRLSPSLAQTFDGMQVSVKPVETILHGPVADQEELFGLLDQLQALGLPSKLGATATVRMMSAATRNSRLSKIARPTCCR